MDINQIIDHDINERIRESFETECIEDDIRNIVTNKGGFGSVLTYVTEQHLGILVPFVKNMLIIKKMKRINGLYCITPELLQELFDISVTIEESNQTKTVLVVMHKSDTCNNTNTIDFDYKDINGNKMISYNTGLNLIKVPYSFEIVMYNILSDMYKENLNAVVNIVLEHVKNILSEDDYNKYVVDIEDIKEDLTNGKLSD